MLDYGYYSIITRKPHLGSFCTLLLCCCVFIKEDFLVLLGQTKHLKLPVHYGIKCFHCIQVHVAIMTSNCKNFSHQCCYANTTPGSCELCHIFPFVTAWVKALHWAQGRVVIKATCKQWSQGQFFWHSCCRGYSRLALSDHSQHSGGPVPLSLYHNFKN